MVRIDNKDVTFANQTAGRWEKNPTKYGKHGGFKGIWLYEKSLKITQFVEKVPGDPFLNDGKLVRAVDTCLVKYEIENLDKADHVVGLRVLLDTLIGANDGAPFTIAGESALVDKQKNFSTADTIPDFVQALEKPDLQDPGVVVRLKLRHQDLESPTRLLLTRWPALNDKQKLFEWDVPMEDFTIDKGASDSAAVIYWDPRPLAPGKSRTVGFAYGLVHLVTGAGGLGATYSGDPAPNKKITITAYVSQPQVDETLTLQLPDGMKLMDGSVATQKVSMPRGSLMTNPNPITWNVMATTTGSFAVTISSNKNRSVQISLGISAGGIFGGS